MPETATKESTSDKTPRVFVRFKYFDNKTRIKEERFFHYPGDIEAARQAGHRYCTHNNCRFMDMEFASLNVKDGELYDYEP